MTGSINIDLDGKFASWAGALLAHDRPIVFIGVPGSQQEAAMSLGRSGFDNVTGYLSDGMMALAKSPELVGRLERITALTVHEQLREGSSPCVLDVRAPGEREQSCIPESLHIPLPQLLHRLDDLPRDRPVIVNCAGGYHSAVASSLLILHGFERVMDLVGGISAWEAAGLPTSA